MDVFLTYSEASVLYNDAITCIVKRELAMSVDSLQSDRIVPN